MPTYKKKRRRNKKTRRNRKYGGKNMRIARITDAKTGKYLGKRIDRTTEGKNKDEYSPYIEPYIDINFDPVFVKYANSLLFSTLKPSDIKQTEILVRVNNMKEEAQMVLYNFLKNNFLKDEEFNIFDFFKEDNSTENKKLFDCVRVWTNGLKSNDITKYFNDDKKDDKKNNKSYFPKYFEKNPISNPPKNINELKDDIYPLITDKIVEYFMDQVIATMDKDTKDKCLIIYIKDDKNTYNNVRYVIMHILNFIEMPIKEEDVIREVAPDEAKEREIEEKYLELAQILIQIEKNFIQIRKKKSKEEEKELEEEKEKLEEEKKIIHNDLDRLFNEYNKLYEKNIKD